MISLGLHGRANSTPAAARSGASVSMRELIRLLRIDFADDTWLPKIALTLRRTRSDETLVQAGDSFHSLYVVSSGCFKIVYADVGGNEQVLGFPMSGDLIGTDGIDTERYACSAVSLCPSEVAVIPFATMAELADQCPSLGSLYSRVVSRELVRVQKMAWVLGMLSAEGRVAAFLLSLSERLGPSGSPCCAFGLHMNRQEMASYLCLTRETVGRTLSALETAGTIQITQRVIEIIDIDALSDATEPSCRARNTDTSARKPATKSEQPSNATQHPTGFAWPMVSVNG